MYKQKTIAERRSLRHKRGRGKVSGTKERPRLCVFISNAQVYAQIIDDREGRTLVASSTLNEDMKEPAKGKSKTERAKLVGARIALLAKEAGIVEVVFDKSGYKYGRRLSAMADAAREGGLRF